MCSDSEAGSYLRLIDFVYHSTLGLRAMQKKKIVDFVYHSTLGMRAIKMEKKIIDFVYHSTLGLSAIKKKKKTTWVTLPWREAGPPHHYDDTVDPDQ